ncbi:MAG: ATP-dependent Clp protease ATP-binding subunit [Patescibacteria group bacterium]
MDLPSHFSKVFLWVFVRVPKRIFVLLEHILFLSNNAFAFTLTLKLLFTPLFGDYTIVGRLIGFIFRIIKLAVGLVVMATLLTVSVFALPLWYAFPIYLLLTDVSYFILYNLFLFVSFTILKLRKPELKLSFVADSSHASKACFFDKGLLQKFDISKETFLKELLSNSKVTRLLTLLEVNKNEFLMDFSKRVLEIKAPSQDLLQKSFDFAKEKKNDYIELEHVFGSILKLMPQNDMFLAKFSLKTTNIEDAIYWVVSQRDHLRRIFFWQEDYVPPPIGGVNRGMTSRITPVLNSVSQDFTQMAARGYFDKVVGKEKAMKEAIDALSKGGGKNVLIVGEPGCGKTTMVRGLALKIIEGTEAKALKFKRLVSVEMGALISGARSPGEVSQKVEKIMEEAYGAGNVIMFIDEVHNLVASTGSENAELASVFSFLEPHLSSGKIQFIGATSFPNYRRYIEPNGAFARLFQLVVLEEATPQETLEVLKVMARKFGKTYKVDISFLALEKTIELSKKLIKDRVLPDKAIDILERASVSVSKSSKYVNSQVITEIISEITKIPVTAVTVDETNKLLNIEVEIKKRVIGQDEAVFQIGDALRRGRLGIRDEKRPIASFLFVGSTGVGKTETAKALASTYFGSEEIMIRVDMSEYQKDDSIDKLIGTSDGYTTGLLTDKVRRYPYSLILLDEIEKASSRVLLVFLQVLDDGRLTDSQGRVIDFSNSIIIATSNAGTSKIQEIMQNRGSYESMKEEALKEVRQRFAPEFLNRFSGIITFKPLYPSDVMEITSILLERVIKTLDDKGVRIKFKQELIDKLAHDGFDPQWGARPLRRLIENTVESYLARKLLTNEIVQGDSIEIGLEVFK